MPTLLSFTELLLLVLLLLLAAFNAPCVGYKDDESQTQTYVNIIRSYIKPHCMTAAHFYTCLRFRGMCVCLCIGQTDGKKGKVFPYSLPSVGPGADPGVQAVSPQVT